MASGGISGCSWQHVNVNSYPKTFAGDLLTPNYAKANVRITEAWKRTNGAGVTVGVPDSGVNNQAPMNQWFATGHSTGRWHEKLFRKGTTPHGPCSHGTRVAGVIAAPMNGSSAAGIAWRSNLVTVRVFDEAPYHHFPPSRFWRGIRDAASHRPEDRGGNQDGHANQRIVTIAWNTQASNAIRDEIRTWHGRGRLFLGAAGQGLGRLHTNQIGFPARMTEVVAVSAVNVDGSRRTRYHYGPDVEMSFYEQSAGHRQKAPGETTFEVSDLRGTSSTVAAVSGIAALIWSQYPNASRDWVRTRLQQSGDSYPRRFGTGGFGIPNAVRAVGGVYRVTVTGAPEVATPNTNYTLTANHLGGSSPFSYSWSTGGSGRSITWRAPSQPGFYTVSVTVGESGGTRTTGSTLINVGGDPNCSTCLEPSPGG